MRSILKKQKVKSDFTSLIVLGIVFVLAFGIIAVFFSHAFTGILDELINSGEFSDNSIDTMEGVRDQTIPLLDFMVFFLFISAVIGLIIASIYIDIPPAAMVAFIIALIIAVFIAGQFTNLWEEATAVDEVQGTAGQFSKTNLILGNAFPAIIFITGIIIIIIIYGKSRRVAEV